MTALDSSRRIVDSALAEFGKSLAILTSFQREGVVILDLVLGVAPQTPVITIDTGRLPRETFDMVRAIEARYGIEVERIAPEPAEVDAMVATHGRELFRESVPERMLCCNVRKVRPLARRMSATAACFTGMRRGQNAERAGIEVFDRSGRPVKINPLAAWTSEDVARYSLEQNLPEHPLYAAGYTSIGCQPCARAVGPGEGERAGRWWWEIDTAKECGLHFSADGRAERSVDVLVRELLSKNEPA